MKTYRGQPKKSGGSIGPGTIKVLVDDENGKREYTLTHIQKHSPSGLNWGYSGSGCADTAISILTDCVGEIKAEKYCQDFKFDIVKYLPFTEWELTEEKIKSLIQNYENGKGDVCDKCDGPLERYEVNLCFACKKEVGKNE